MAGNKQMDRLAKIIKQGEERLEASILALQQAMKALLSGGIGPPKPPKKELIRALERLRKALNQAILRLEKSIGGTGGARPKRAAKRRKTSA